MAKRRTQSRSTRIVTDLAMERFRGCEDCWSSDAFDSIDEVLEPLRLNGRELRRLLPQLTCPRCGSRIRLGMSVVRTTEGQIRQSELSRRFDGNYREDLEAFRSFLIKYPMLGGQRPFGRVLFQAIGRATRFRLEPATWFRATKELTNPQFGPRPPHKVDCANRFNQIGQAGWYLGSDEKTAAVEVLREPRPSTPSFDAKVCVASIEILEPTTVLDLRTALWGEDRSENWILRNVIDSRFLSEPINQDDRSCPQYRIPQFVADLARRRGYQGIFYNSSRPSPYNNPEAVGSNVVIFDPNIEYRILSQSKIEFSEPDHDAWSLERWPVTGGGCRN